MEGHVCRAEGAVIVQAELRSDLGVESMVSGFGGFSTLVPQPYLTLQVEEERRSAAGSEKEEEPEEEEEEEEEEEYDEEEEEEDDDRPPKKPRHGGFILDEAGM